MRLFLVVLLAAVMLLPALPMASSAPFFTLSGHSNESVTFSYKLEDRDRQFWYDVRDALRAGEDVAVRHRIMIYHQRPYVWNKRIARATATVGVRYNLFENRFNIGIPGQAREHVFFGEEIAEEAILTMQHVQLKLDEPLKSGETYRIRIETQMLSNPAMRGWQRYLPIEGLFRPQIIQEVTHVEP